MFCLLRVEEESEREEKKREKDREVEGRREAPFFCDEEAEVALFVSCAPRPPSFLTSH